MSREQFTQVGVDVFTELYWKEKDKLIKDKQFIQFTLILDKIFDRLYC